MRIAKIGSKSTYHRCVTDLDAWSYLSIRVMNRRRDSTLEHLAERYHPIREPVVYQHRPVSGQALVPYINNTKQVNNNKQPKGRQAILIFFEEKGFSADGEKNSLSSIRAMIGKPVTESDKDWCATGSVRIWKG